MNGSVIEEDGFYVYDIYRNDALGNYIFTLYSIHHHTY